jgi:GNAT superfamily N-acetyltransferase
MWDIRPGSEADWAACMEVWHRSAGMAHAFLGAEALQRQSEDIRHRFLPSSRVVVADVRGTVVAFAAWLEDAQHAELGGLFVHPSWQGRALGTELLRSSAPRDRPVCVHVYRANRSARRFYERLGFRAMADTANSDAPDGLELLVAARGILIRH